MTHVDSKRRWRCVNDRYSPGAELYGSVRAFLDMCRAVFGEIPALVLSERDGAEVWVDEHGHVVLEQAPLRDLDGLLTSEMSEAEWLEYGKRWRAQHRDALISAGESPDDPMLEVIVDVHWERYCGQEGWTGRDERIAAGRDR